MADPQTALEHTVIHRALSRPSLLLGADRELILLLGLIAAISAFVVLTWFAVAFGFAMWVVALGTLRLMAKADPMMRRIYLRHIRYRSIYRATATPWRRA